jgi:hypothetical protein
VLCAGETKPVTFRRVLLNTCQDEFEAAEDARQVRSAVRVRVYVRVRVCVRVCVAAGAGGGGGRAGRGQHAAHRLSTHPPRSWRDLRARTTITPPPPATPGTPPRAQELSAVRDPDERAAVEKGVKSRTIGTVRLIAELYRKDVVTEAIILVCIRELLEVCMCVC